MADYRKPTMKESEKLEKSRSLMVQGIEGEKDFLSKLSTTAAKAARDDMRMARSLRESVPARAREGEAYDLAGYKAGGKVKKYAEGGKVTNKELFAPLQAAFDKHEKKKADKAEEKKRLREERDANRSGSMVMDEMGMKSGGKVSSASKRADGCAIRGKTKA